METQVNHPVTLRWDIMPNGGLWNEICAWTVEHFGLPGHRYRTEVTEEKMTWYFNCEKDQLMFIIAWGDHGR